MSRAYRIRVSESLSRILRASDRVSTQLELLAVLPADESAALLAAELERAGFEECDGVFVLRDGAIQIEVDPSNGNVVVQAEATRAFEQELTRDGWSTSERSEQRALDQDRLAGQVRQQLETAAQSESDKLQRQVTDRLEQALLDIRPQLDRIVNRVTVEALKRKAAAMGRVKSIAEDADGGSLTIVLEV